MPGEDRDIGNTNFPSSSSQSVREINQDAKI